MSRPNHHHIPLVYLQLGFLKASLQVGGRDNIAGRQSFLFAHASHVQQDAAREEYAHVLNAELLVAKGVGELGSFVAVIEIVVVVHVDADMAKAVELSANLADLATKHFIERNELVFAGRRPRRRAADGQYKGSITR